MNLMMITEHAYRKGCFIMIGCVKLFNSNHNRGDYTEITYYDETDRMIDPQEASRVRIREMLADGSVVKESWGFCGIPVKRPA